MRGASYTGLLGPRKNLWQGRRQGKTAGTLHQLQESFTSYDKKNAMKCRGCQNNFIHGTETQAPCWTGTFHPHMASACQSKSLTYRRPQERQPSTSSLEYLFAVTPKPSYFSDLRGESSEEDRCCRDTPGFKWHSTWLVSSHRKVAS